MYRPTHRPLPLYGYPALALALLAGPASDQAMAQDRELPVVTGTHWAGASEAEKKAFLLGMGTIIEIEHELQSASPSTAPVDSFIGKLVAGLDGYTITGISDGLDDWYAANPAQSATPVIEVIWSEMVLPNLTAEEAGR